jgi:hypothetical protein
VTKVQPMSEQMRIEVTDRGNFGHSTFGTRTPPHTPHDSKSPRHGLATRQPTVLVALFFASLLFAACGSGSSPASAPTTDRPSTSTSTTQGPTGAAGAALSAYRAMWADMVIASRTADYQSPLLPQHASGTALSLLVRGLAKNQAQGIVVKGNPRLQPQVTSLSPLESPTEATISDCVDDTHWLDYKTNGELFNSIPGGRHATMAIVMDTYGQWKVTELAVQAVGTC